MRKEGVHQELCASFPQRSGSRWSQMRDRIRKRPKLFAGLAIVGILSLAVAVTLATIASRDAVRSADSSLANTDTSGDDTPISAPSFIPIPQASKEPAGTVNEGIKLTQKPAETSRPSPFYTPKPAQPMAFPTSTTTVFPTTFTQTAQLSSKPSGSNALTTATYAPTKTIKSNPTIDGLPTGSPSILLSAATEKPASSNIGTELSLQPTETMTSMQATPVPMVQPSFIDAIQPSNSPYDPPMITETSIPTNRNPSDSLPTSSPSVPVLGATKEPAGSNNEAEPTQKPTEIPTRAPTYTPRTGQPIESPTKSPSWTPTVFQATQVPTIQSPDPSVSLSSSPTAKPTSSPTKSPTAQPSNSHSDRPITATYIPGQLTVSQNGLLLSQGLTSRIIARTNQTVKYDFGGQSNIPFQMRPDFGATFIDTQPGNEGGFIYVINSEVKKVKKRGGVGAFTFDRDGNVREYKMVLENTTANCGGGRTPWGAWISCEEYRLGKNWQVDPTGERPGAPITLGNDGGLFESFTYDVRNEEEPRFFVTEDHEKGPLQRFTPSNPNWDDPWNVLYGEGVTDYLLMFPDDSTCATGRYEWTRDKNLAKENAKSYYPNCEGIDVYANELFFVSKKYKVIYTLNLDGETYTNQTTRRGIFDGQPDQLQRILGDKGELLYFTEEGGRDAGIHARNDKGQFFTILESPVYHDETTGLAFSPDGKHLFLAYQENGIVFQVKREDGLPFHQLSLNVKYHAVAGG